MDKSEREQIQERVREYDLLHSKISRLERFLEAFDEVIEIKVDLHESNVTYIKSNSSQHKPLCSDDDDCFVSDLLGFIETSLKQRLQGFKDDQANV